MTCTHHWTVTNECPAYLRDEIERLAARVRELEAERDEWEAEVGRRASVWQERAERAEAEVERIRNSDDTSSGRQRDALRADNERLRALLRRVLSCGLNEEPHGAGFTPSRQERLAGELAADISATLAQKEKS